MNKVILIGRLTDKPTLKEIGQSNSVASFNLAVDKGLSKSRKQKLETEGKPTADFPRIQAWGALAKTCHTYLDKGSQCAVVGRIQTGSYENEQGQRIYTTDVVAENVEFLSPGASNSNETKNNNEIDDFFPNDFKEIEVSGNIPF